MFRGVLGVVLLLLTACSSPPVAAPAPPATTTTTVTTTTATSATTTTPVPTTTAAPTTTPSRTRATAAPAGNLAGRAPVPPEAAAVDTSRPTRVIGDGTPASCTSRAVVAAVAGGGIVTFDCGPDPVTVTMTSTAQVRNDAAPEVVLDGGGLVTLSGAGQRRVLYQNTCDPLLGITTPHCQDQDHPRLTIQNITLADGNSAGLAEGGGAVFARGGRVKVVNSTFLRNKCDRNGPDLGGAGMRVLSQSGNRPVFVVGSTFDGGTCANGGALSSIGVSWVVLNSVLRDNSAVGRGANPARPGTPGGGSGGALYADGNTFTVRIAGSVLEDNKANEGGGAVFFVSNDRSGTMAVESSTLRRNPSAGFETAGYKGIFFLGAADPSVTASTIQ